MVTNRVITVLDLIHVDGQDADWDSPVKNVEMRIDLRIQSGVLNFV